MTFELHLCRATGYRRRQAGLPPAPILVALTLVALAPAFGRVADAQEPGAPQDAGARETMSLEMIIVTAERLDRSIMDTSTSVIVVDGETLDRRLVEGANDLLAQMPNITATGGTNVAPAVRGVDGTGPAQGGVAAFAGTRSRLNVQVDGRPITYNELVYGDLGVWDLQQIEMLRGPQSALQGRNAIAGTLAMKTKDPTYETEGKLRVIGGDLQTRQYSAAFSAPIVADQLAFRLAADRRSSESFAEYAAFEGAGGFPGVNNPGEYETTTYRGKLLIEPRAWEDFSALLTVSYAKSRAPQNEDVPEPVADDDFVAAFPPMPVFMPRNVGGVAELSWKASDALTLETRAGWTDFELLRLAGIFGSSGTEGREYYIEPLARFELGGLSGLAGLYYFDARQDDFHTFGSGGIWDDSTRTKAVFAETTYRLSSFFDVTLGARYEEEHRFRFGALDPFATDLDETYDAFSPKLVLSWHPTEQLTVGALAARGYNAGGAGVLFLPPFTSFTFEPEYVWNYEVFTRATLAGGQLLLLGNVFYSDYEDMQLPLLEAGGFAEESIIVNAEKVITYGAELSARWQVLPTLQLTAGLGLLETDIKKFSGSGLERNELPQAPPISGDVGVRYQLGGLELSGQARYSDSYFSDVANLQAQRTDAYWQTNLQAAYNFTHVRVFAAVNNVFDENKRLFRYPPFELAGVQVPTSATILRPRTYSVGVQVEF